MKKLLSIIIAVVLVFAVCVPAFAAEINEKSEQQDANVNITTNTENAQSEYTVTIPADFEIAWGDSDAKVKNYSVYTNLVAGASLTVEVTADNNGLMTATSGSDTLTFTLTGGSEEEFTLFNLAGTEPETDVTVKIDNGQWKQAAIGEYSGSLTYTVTYTAPVTP